MKKLCLCILLVIGGCKAEPKLEEPAITNDYDHSTPDEIFDFYQLKDFILGYSSESIDDILFVSGLSSYCIENYWLVYILKFGIVFTILIAYFYGSFFIRLLQRTSSFHKMFLLGSFLLISSTNNSLATDSIALSVLTLCCYCLPPMKIS